MLISFLTHKQTKSSARANVCKLWNCISERVKKKSIISIWSSGVRISMSVSLQWHQNLRYKYQKLSSKHSKLWLQNRRKTQTCAAEYFPRFKTCGTFLRNCDWNNISFCRNDLNGFLIIIINLVRAYVLPTGHRILLSTALRCFFLIQ